MRSPRDLRGVGITLVGVVLLFAAVFAASYALAHQEHQHHAQSVLLRSERAAMAKIATRSHGASCQVAGVQPGSAAQKAGIVVGDRLRAVNGTPTDNATAFIAYVKSHAGMPVTLQVERGGQAGHGDHAGVLGQLQHEEPH